jgi:hypothetical protein
MNPPASMNFLSETKCLDKRNKWSSSTCCQKFKHDTLHTQILFQIYSPPLCTTTDRQANCLGSVLYALPDLGLEGSTLLQCSADTILKYSIILKQGIHNCTLYWDSHIWSRFWAQTRLRGKFYAFEHLLPYKRKNGNMISIINIVSSLSLVLMISWTVSLPPQKRYAEALTLRMWPYMEIRLLETLLIKMRPYWCGLGP